MLQISNISLPVDGDEAMLRQKAAAALGVRPGDILALSLHRQSIDARKKTDVRLVCAVRVTLKDEAAVLRRAPKGVAEVADAPYVLPPVRRASSTRPVVVGMGPAGLFAGLSGPPDAPWSLTEVRLVNAQVAGGTDPAGALAGELGGVSLAMPLAPYLSLDPALEQAEPSASP